MIFTTWMAFVLACNGYLIGHVLHNALPRWLIAINLLAIVLSAAALCASIKPAANPCEYSHDTQWLVVICNEDGAEIGRCNFPAGPVITNRRSYVGGEHHGLASGVGVRAPYSIRVSRNGWSSQ